VKILLVEDDENKRLQLQQFVEASLPDAELWQERSLQTGLRHVRREVPDLVLLDMTIPNYDIGPDESGGQTHIFGGLEFLRQLDRFDIHVPVIVVTQFETFGKPPETRQLNDLDAELRAEHSPDYRGAIYYNAAIHDWKAQLLSLINELDRE
jgi:DNA-binding NarL/FixJ family response regulator